MTATGEHPIMVVSGPTASGKSALALALAESLGGVIINADSKQVYRELRILSARPTEAEERQAPHRLYGTIAGDRPYSAGAWLREVLEVIAEVRQQGRVPILCGGSSLYLQALLFGLSSLPETPPAIRAEGQRLWEREGLAGLQRAVAACDPAYWTRVDQANPARLLRAWEVARATGIPLSRWQQQQPPEAPLPGQRWVWIWLEPDRDWLYARINARFQGMLHAGVEEEIAALLALHYPPDAPVMKAHGVPEWRAYFAGEMDLDSAIARAQQVTRNYAKRQQTWYRRQWQAGALPCHALDPSAQTPDQLLAACLTFWQSGGEPIR